MTQTLIIVILDESGSMSPKKTDVLDGFNTFLDEQKKLSDEDVATFYLIKFNTITNVVYKGIDVKLVPQLNGLSYTPGGGTALFDAIAEAVSLADKDKTEDQRVVCVIMTDGEENSSRETTLQQVRDVITGYEAKGDWTFLYIGQNPERWTRETGMSFGNAVAYDDRNVKSNLKQMAFGVTEFRLQKCQQLLNVYKK